MTNARLMPMFRRILFPSDSGVFKTNPKFEVAVQYGYGPLTDVGL